MEIVRRIVNLESSKSRFDGKLPSYVDNIKQDVVETPVYEEDEDDYSDWNKSPVNIIISNDSKIYPIKDRIPLVNDISGNLVLRFRTMVEVFTFLKRFSEKSVFYKLCNQNGSIGWREVDIDFFNEWKGDNLNTSTPDIEQYGIGDIVCVNPESDKYISLFKIDGDTHRYDVDFYNFVLDLKVNGTRHYSEPFINIPVYLEEEIVDNGILTPYSDLWESGRKYYLGEYVFHAEDGTESGIRTYRLVRGGVDGDGNLLYDLLNATGNIYEIVKREYDNRDSDGLSEHYRFITSKEAISGTLFNNNDNGIIRKQILVENAYDTPIFNFVNVYYTGFLNPFTKLIDFDENGDNPHWEIADSFADTPGDYEPFVVNGKCESKLDIFASKKKSYSASGEVLPFCFDDDSKPASDGKYYADIPYTKGVVITSDGQYCYLEDPVINSVNQTITFTYHIGCEVNTNDNDSAITIVEDTGIKYIESFTYAYKTYDMYYQDTNTYKEIVYMDIDLTTGEYADNDDINSIGGSVRVADVSFRSDSLSNEMYLKTFAFKDEATSRLISANKDIDASIERGDYAAFERHNLLGEIKTFSDLKNYRNNFFNL